jgi:hypothetical protein
VSVVNPVEVTVHTPLYLRAVPVQPEITTCVPVVIPWFVAVVIVAVPEAVAILLIVIKVVGAIFIKRLAP